MVIVKLESESEVSKFQEGMQPPQEESERFAKVLPFVAVYRMVIGHIVDASPGRTAVGDASLLGIAGQSLAVVD